MPKALECVLEKEMVKDSAWHGKFMGTAMSVGLLPGGRHGRMRRLKLPGGWPCLQLGASSSGPHHLDEVHPGQPTAVTVVASLVTKPETAQQQR